MSYPSPEQLLSHAEHARSMSDAYLAEGNISMAERRKADADWYKELCTREEWRLAQINEHQEEA